VIDDLVRDILAKLEMLADAPTQVLDPNRVSSSATKSKAPAGVGQRGDTTRPPDKDRVSLFEWYSWHFAEATAEGDDQKLRSLYLLAQTDYVDFRFRPDWRTELRKGELDERDAADPEAVERKAAERVVDHYAGLPAHYVATLEGSGCTVAWVRKARRWHARDPETGREQPEFYAWDDGRRKREIEALQALGLGSTKIAERLGVARNTVRRYLPEVAVEREPVAA
jgi:hypothetical protein